MGDSRNRMLNEHQDRKNMKKRSANSSALVLGNERTFLWGKRYLAK